MRDRGPCGHPGSGTTDAALASGGPVGLVAPLCEPGEHDWRYSGKGAPQVGQCDQPTKLVCVRCGTWYLRRCGRAKASRCEPCAEVHRLDVAAIGRSGWARGARGSTGVWLTLTAPGADRLPFDPSQCSHGPGVACSGSIGCRCEPMALARWHHGLGLRWSHFMTEVRRLLPGLDVQFFKTWEEQLRGALHAHAMLRLMGVVTERRFRAAVRLAAHRYGFGSQLDLQFIDLADPAVMDMVEQWCDETASAEWVEVVVDDPVAAAAARKAGYCAKYASKSADRLESVRTIDPWTGELRACGFRPWSASRRWGDTMRAVVMRRRTWATAGHVVPGVPADVAAGGAEGAPLDLYRDHYATDDLCDADEGRTAM